ncbi:MAG: FAD-dependent oxidoreductase [Myxococcota bacterium]
MKQDNPPVLIVGAGIAGLIAAIRLASAGHSVEVLERRSTPGGRATSATHRGFVFNQGAHALYRTGPLSRELAALGLEPSGRSPAGGRGMKAVRRGTLHLLPQSVLTTALSGLLGTKDKLSLARALGQIQRARPSELASVSVSEWVADLTPRAVVCELLTAIIRLSTYAGSPRLSAEVAANQLQLAMKGVLYLDGGWQQLVDLLRTRATDSGVRFHLTAEVIAAEERDGGVVVWEKNGTAHHGAAVIVATSPAIAGKITGSETLQRFAEHAEPAKVSTLTVGVRGEVRPVDFVLGIDEPTYFSVHSRTANLAPAGDTLIEVVEYWESPHDELASREARLSDVVDQAIGLEWRERVAHRRFLPAMTTTHAVPTAAEGGLSGRPPSALSDRPRSFIAGDWVGPTGHLSDASAASGAAAANLVLALLDSRPRAGRHAAGRPAA